MIRVSPDGFLPHEYFQTAGRNIADSLAMQLDPREMRSVDKALHSIAHGVDAGLTSRRATIGTEWAAGGAIADHVTSGEMLVIFADAHPKRGFAAAQVYVQAVADFMAAKPGPRQRAEANAVARRISSQIVRDEVDGRDIQHSGLIALAGCLLTEPQVRRLAEVRDAVSILAVIGDTRSTGITSGRFFASLKRLPGDWFGTSGNLDPVGRC